jgi:hypothetical protein
MSNIRFCERAQVMFLKLTLIFILPAAPGAGLARAAQAEARGGLPAVEDSSGPLAERWRAEHCAARRQSAKRFRSEQAAFDLLPCLSHPSRDVRLETLDALDRREYFLRPDFGKAILPKLRLAVAYSSKDQDLLVRQMAGQLSRDIERWEGFDSPAAHARAAQFRRDELWRTWRDFFKVPDAWAGIGLILILGFVFRGFWKKRPRR